MSTTSFLGWAAFVPSLLGLAVGNAVAQDGAKLRPLENAGGGWGLGRVVGLIRQSGVPRGARRQPRRPPLSRRGGFIKRR